MLHSLQFISKGDMHSFTLIRKRFGVQRKGGLGRLGTLGNWRVSRTIVESILPQQTRLLGKKEKRKLHFRQRKQGRLYLFL